MKRLNQIEEGLEKMVAKYSKNSEGMERDKRYIAHVFGITVANILYLLSVIELYYIYQIFGDIKTVKVTDIDNNKCYVKLLELTGIHHYNFDIIEQQFLYSKYLYESRQNGIENAYWCGKNETVVKYKGCIKILFDKLSLIDFDNADDKTIKNIESMYQLLTDTIDDFGFKITNLIKNGTEYINIPKDKFNDIFFRALYKKMIKEKLITGQELQALIDEK